MPNAPVFGDSNMTVTSSPANPPNKAEQLPKLDPVFMTAWNQSKYLFPTRWQGDPNFIVSVAVVASRYKTGSGVTTPAITTIAPTSTAKNVAFTLTVNGSNFDANAIVILSGIDQPMATLTPTQLTASISAATIKTAGTYPIQVRNANGTISNTVNLTVV
jgi:IPT/TIG domain